MYGSTQRRQIISSEEQDAFTNWRQYYCYLKRAKACKRIKRRANRRERQAGKKELRMGWEERS